MAFQHGKNGAVLLGEYDLSAYLNAFDTEISLEANETTTFGKSAKTYQAGLLDGSASASGLYDKTAGASDEVLQAALGAANGKVLSLFFTGLSTQGNRGRLAVAHETSYKVTSAIGDIVGCSADFQPSDGLWGCVLLEALAAKTATANGTALDNAAATTNGYVANLHCTAASGTSPTLDLKIQHSADNSTWADLCTFTQLTAAGSEQKTGTGTVNRYLRVVDTIGGTSPSFTRAVSIARK